MVGRLLMIAGFLFVGVAASVSAQTQAQAEQQPQSGACSLTSTYPVVSVNPYTSSSEGGFPVPKKTRGAVLHVKAQPGLTKEWLQRSVETSVAGGDCGFASDTQVTVQSAGGGFDLVLTAPDEAGGRRIVDQAQQLQQR
jgi:hypothetical protein